MKKCILIIGLLFAVLQANAQCGLPYKPFSDFKGDSTLLNDTLSYLEYNIDTRRGCYIGKTVGELLDEVEISIKSFATIFNGSNYVPRIELILSNTRSETQYHGISIYLDEQLRTDSLKKIRDKYPNVKWVKQHENFFKDYIIKNISTNYLKRISLESEYYNRLHEKYGKDFNESMIELK